MIYNAENVKKIMGFVDKVEVTEMQIIEIDTEQKTVLTYKLNDYGDCIFEGNEVSRELLKPKMVRLMINGTSVKWG